MKRILIGFLSLYIISTTANAITGYKLIYKGNDEGIDEYPAVYVEIKSLKKANGIVTATTLERHRATDFWPARSGYKIKLQINCKAKTAKYLDAIWLGNTHADHDMVPDFIGDTIKITSKYDGPYNIYKIYCK